MKKLIYTSPSGHKVHIVGIEQVSNGGLVTVLHCCGDPSTEHRTTHYHCKEVNGVIVHGLDQQSLTDKLAAQVAPDLASQHESMQAAIKFFNSMKDDGEQPSRHPSMSLID